MQPSQDTAGSPLPAVTPTRWPDRLSPPVDESVAPDIDEAMVLRARVLDGDVDALMRLRHMLEPIAYGEMGCGD
jgi:hypothetical protein